MLPWGLGLLQQLPPSCLDPHPPPLPPISGDCFLSTRLIGRPSRGSEENLALSLRTSKSLETPSCALISHSAVSINPGLPGEGNGRHVEVRQRQLNDLATGFALSGSVAWAQKYSPSRGDAGRSQPSPSAAPSLALHGRSRRSGAPAPGPSPLVPAHSTVDVNPSPSSPACRFLPGRGPPRAQHSINRRGVFCSFFSRVVRASSS